MRVSHGIIKILALFFLPQTVLASDENTLRHLEKIQTETVILEAQISLAKAKKELEASGNGREIQSRQVMSSTISTLLPKPHTLPRIQEIYGTGKQLFVRLLLADNSLTELTRGQSIPGTDLKITSISAREVRVSNGENESILTFN